MTTSTMTWKQAYDLIDARPINSLIQKSPCHGDKNCVLAVLALDLGFNLDYGVIRPVQSALGATFTQCVRLMDLFDNAETVALGKERSLTYIHEQMEGENNGS